LDVSSTGCRLIAVTTVSLPELTPCLVCAVFLLPDDSPHPGEAS